MPSLSLSLLWWAAGKGSEGVWLGGLGGGGDGTPSGHSLATWGASSSSTRREVIMEYSAVSIISKAAYGSNAAGFKCQGRDLPCPL